MTTRSDTDWLLREALTILDKGATLPPRPTQYRRGFARGQEVAAAFIRRALSATPPDTSGLQRAIVDELWSLGPEPDVLVRIEEAVAAVNSRWSIETRHDELHRTDPSGLGDAACVRSKSGVLCETHGRKLWPSLARRCNGWAAIQESRAGGGLTELDAEIARRQAPSYEWAPRADMHGRGGIGQAMQRGELTGLLIAQHLVHESRAGGANNE